MARYLGPKTKVARRFKEAIFGPDKSLERRMYPPGQHGQSRKRTKQTEYATELRAREFYEKPTAERKRKKAAAVKRHYKRVRSMQLPKKLY
jgi:ribosomal protein S21